MLVPPAKIYQAIGGAAGCHALATAFYAHVEREPILRPLFPSTFTCAIEEFAAFLVQFLGGDTANTQRRWWLSLRESHNRFPIGPRERESWLRAMAIALEDESLGIGSDVRSDLLRFFTHSSAHVVNRGEIPADEQQPIHGELASLWDQQLALDEAIAAIRIRQSSAHCMEYVQSPALRALFGRSPAVHASFLAEAAASNTPGLREYAFEQLRVNPLLVSERYKHGRTLLHDACGAGDLPFVELVLDLGGGKHTDNHTTRSPLYCLANESSTQDGAEIVRILVRRTPAQVNAVHGVKRCTALHMAARRGNTSVIGALLDHGANLEARDSAGDTPLRRAVNCNKVEAARLLLARGADPRSRGSKAMTPAEAARSNPMRHLFADPRSVAQ